MISLFDYLGYPAGPTLGKQVYIYAKSVKAKTGTKIVSNSPYKDGVIVVTNRTDGDFIAGGISVYSLIGDEMIFKKTIILNKLKQLHGCRIIDEKNFINYDCLCFVSNCFYIMQKS